MASASPSSGQAVEVVTWDRFTQIVRQLAEMTAAFDPHLILGVTRGGLFPATMLSFALRHELHPIRLTHQRSDNNPQERPFWIIRPPDKVRGRRVLIVHEIAESGRTLDLAAAETRAMGASQVRTASLYAHTWADPRPDYVVLTTDALILSPWDREVFSNGQWVTHPELSAALHEQASGPAGDPPAKV